MSRQKQPVYLVDVECYKPPEDCRVRSQEIFNVWTQHKMFSDEDLAFHLKVLGKSGLSADGTYLPHSINPIHCAGSPKIDLASAMVECRQTVLGAVEGLLNKTGLKPRDIDIVVTTCSIFCPIPSMSSMVVNHFKMRSDVITYHLGGMGCSNGVVGINLIRDLLQAHPNVNAVFVTTEVTTPAFYKGPDRHRQVTNLLFRMGASAVLLSNNASWGPRTKYLLQHHERVHVGASDDAYGAIYYGPDAVGVNGIYLGKDVVHVASRALTKILWKIGPKVLNLEQKLKYLRSSVAGALGITSVPPFTPNFSGSLEHFVIHAGGSKVLDGLGKALQLSEVDLEPSRAVLFHYGNVSSSTTWYTLAYIESVRGVKKGDRVMQIGVGSGIKCGVNVWKATRRIDSVHDAWEHCTPPEKRQQAQKRTYFVDTSGLGQAYFFSRVLFMILMAFLVGSLHMLLLNPSSVQQQEQELQEQHVDPLTAVLTTVVGSKLGAEVYATATSMADDGMVCQGGECTAWEGW